MRFKKCWLLMVLVLLTWGLIGCSNSSYQTSRIDEDAKDNEKLNVVVSILPQADFIEMLAGDEVEVTVMIPPGASPDSYEPSTGQLKSLSKADLYIKVGHLPFEEAWMDRILVANKNLMVVDSSEGIEIIDNNPHIWLSPKLVKVQLDTICNALIEVNPDQQAYYLSNKETALSKLDNIDKEIQAKLAEFQGRSFLVYHPAWGYFARDYDLTELAIEDHGKEPGPAEMAKIIAMAKKDGINNIFASPQHSIRSAEAIAAELDGEVVLIDPLPSSYEDILKSAQLISEAIGGSQ